MQRFINDPDFVVDDMLRGIEAAHPEIKVSKFNDRVLTKTQKKVGKVGIVSGGGSGHEPAFLGYIGAGMLDAVAVGEVFASPPAQAFYDAIKEADNGNGVAILFGNYAGDNMNVKMAVQMAEMDGIDVKYVVATDDVASSPKETAKKRHGIAGGFYMWKIGGAMAERGGNLNEVIEVSAKIVNRTRSICVGLSPCTIPAAGKPNFLIEDGTMEFGIGHHGETGIKKEKLKKADEIAQEMTETILEDFDFQDERKLSIMISGLGNTMLMEQYIIAEKVIELVKDAGHTIESTFVGDFVTSLDMGGISLTIVDMDEELIDLMDEPAQPFGLKNY